MSRSRARSVVIWFLLSLLLAAVGPLCFAHAPWVTLQGGHYLVKRPNDGDSFHVSVAGHEYIFRLYFVDAPETTAEFRDRVEEQAVHFGITVDRVIQTGELAKQFVRDKLTEPFLVRTCWEDAGGRSRMQRFYAFVQIRSGDLGEQLVENGLARSHPGTAKPEGLTSAAAEWQKLVELERKARQEKVGGWGANENGILVRARDPESEKGVDPFDKFFHPEEPRQSASDEVETTPAAAYEISSPMGRASPAAPPRIESSPSEHDAQFSKTKLNINTASQVELENISGIGPVMAQRIIAARPFKSADDLRRVKGIGDKTFARIRPFFQ